MKVTHVLIGVGAVIAAVVVYKKFLAPKPETPAQQVGGGVQDIISGARGVVEGITGIFGQKTAPGPSSSSAGGGAQPIGDPLTWDADGDQNGQFATNVIPLRPFA